MFRVESNGGTWFNRQQKPWGVEATRIPSGHLGWTSFLLENRNQLNRRNEHHLLLIYLACNTIKYFFQSPVPSNIFCEKHALLVHVHAMYSYVNDSKFGHQKYCHNCSYGKDSKNQLLGQK